MGSLSQDGRERWPTNGRRLRGIADDEAARFDGAMLITVFC
jgi:hypothetical protein